MDRSLLQVHEDQVNKLKKELEGNNSSVRLKKKTISNLFRYDGKTTDDGVKLDLSAFNGILYLDEENATLDVQGLATNETIADHTLTHGFLPLAAPGFKHITIGGSIVGIGFESTSHRYGYAHDGMVEAEVLLADGTIVVCRADNEFSDLFHALPNSFGTLGYILRVQIQLRKVSPYVFLKTEKYADIDSYLIAMREATSDASVDYIESLAYSEKELYLTIGHDVESADKTMSIYGPTIFYKEISKEGEIILSAKEYLFRYDPEWFWGIPEGWQYDLFRRYAPKWLRNSRTYSRYFLWKQKHKRDDNITVQKEELIQDWIVEWDKAKELFSYAMKNIKLDGKPWMPTPIVTNFSATLFPLIKSNLYFNLGGYTFTSTVDPHEPYVATKMMDEHCFSLGGIKMLYSTSMMDKKTFDGIYNGDAYVELKNTYDSNNYLSDLYSKSIM